MAVRIVRAGDLVRTPWKNGGGTTAEIAVFPPGAGFAEFGWRLSMADVATDGPFSAFAGIDRTLALIDGVELELEVDGNAHRLAAPGDMLSFKGEAETIGRLTAGPIRDLNVMTRRGRFEHRVDHRPPGPIDLPQPDDVLAILAFEDATHIGLDGDAHDLGRFDTLISEGPLHRLSADRPVLRVILSLP